MNKPIYLSSEELSGLRMLMQGDETNPKAPLSKNSRFESKVLTAYTSLINYAMFLLGHFNPLTTES